MYIQFSLPSSIFFNSERAFNKNVKMFRSPSATNRIVERLGGSGIRYKCWLSTTTSRSSSSPCISRALPRSRVVVHARHLQQHVNHKSSIGRVWCVKMQPNNNNKKLYNSPVVGWRSFSSNTNNNNNNNGDNKNNSNDNKAEEETQLVLTPGQKVVAYSRLTMWGGIFGFACCCAYYIGRELFPT
jgi:hypothetical protein